jgi:cell division transport system permease protein
MPWVLAIMMFLTVLAAAAGLGLGNAARNLDSQVGNRLVVQIVEANPDMRERQARRALAELGRLAGV